MVYSITHVNKAMNDAVLDVGYDSPSDEQREAVVKFVNGNDVFVSIPTGAGKSLCYLLSSTNFAMMAELPITA